WMEFSDAEGPTTLALLQGYVENQGDGWSYTQDYLQRFLEVWRVAQPPADAAEMHGAYLPLMETLGQRTAELHKALATRTGDPAFDPEPIEAEDVGAWLQRVRQEAAASLELLQQRRDALPEAAQADADAVLARRSTLTSRLEAAARARV